MARRRRTRSPFSLFSFQDIITCVSGIIILITLLLALELSQRKPSADRHSTSKVASQLRDAISEAQAEVAQLQLELATKLNRASQTAGLSSGEIRQQLFDTKEQITSLNAELVALREQESAATAAYDRLQAEQFNQKSDAERLADLEAKAKDLDEQLNHVRQENKAFYNPRTADGKQVWLALVEESKVIVAVAGQSSSSRALSTESSIFGQSEFTTWLDQRSPSKDFVFLLVRPSGTKQFLELREALDKSDFSIGFDVLSAQQTVAEME